MPRAKGDSNKPRGRMTAYAYFMQTCREEHKNKYPDENVVFLEFSRRCAGQWKLMTENDKKRFQGMAERDKLRFENEMRHYTPPQGATGRGTKRKQVKDPNAPKRSLSAFFWFCHDLRGHVKEQHPEYTLGEIAKELGRRWGVSDDATKATYAAKAEQDRARYERDMNAYKKTKIEPSHNEYYDEDDEEEDDDE